MNREKYVILNPQGIEQESMQIISHELAHISLPNTLAPIIKRVIHTTADFEYAQLMAFHAEAVANGYNALKSGCRIYADTNMITAGVSKATLAKYGCTIDCFVHDKDVVDTAKAKGITRSIAGIDKASGDSAYKVFVIGNAPTALVRLCELYEQGTVKPDLVIGVPVGFVGAKESKEMLRDSGMPYIISRGRKGGSTVAVAILNALLYNVR